MTFGSKRQRLICLGQKIHDTLALLEDCVNIDKNFEVLRKSAELVFPYYIETRYPFGEELVSFDMEKASEAFAASKKVIEFVERKIA
ncbi:HEPN domain-containing protein [Candidatus Curtissbacteria bacterium]|nr:HEPN domain-containing protein [Candidatus Curtissbacteria bacterium]